MDAFVSRAPRELRHRRRAVTSEDYEDLARLASSDIARARCIPVRDLSADPATPAPGCVSLIVVPNTAGPRPQPSDELIRRVQNFVSSSCPVTATLIVVGPYYLQVDVAAEIGIASLDGAGRVASKVQETLAAFLHPLTGGFDGKGWDFGREPHPSDFPGHRTNSRGRSCARTDGKERRNCSPQPRDGRVPLFSGNHNISLVLGS